MNPDVNTTTTARWAKEDAPRWDAAKDRLFGDVELASVGMDRPPVGSPLADEWFAATDDAGEVLGYGWLDAQWGDAQITFVVDPARRGQGVGEFIVGQLEREAADRGLNYIYNVVPPSHPDRAWMERWLAAQGFAGSDDLRRATRNR